MTAGGVLELKKVHSSYSMVKECLYLNAPLRFESARIISGRRPGGGYSGCNIGNAT